MKRGVGVRRLLIGAVIAALLMALTLPALADNQKGTPAPESRERFHVASLVTGVKYSDRHTLYAFGGQAGCAEGKNCVFLMRSGDGGGSWFDMPAAGWSGQPALPVKLGSRELLLAPGKQGLEMSLDGGTSFQSHKLSVSGNTIDAAPHPDGTLDVLISGSEPQLFLTLPSERETKLSAGALSNAMLWFHPRYPKVPTGEPHAFAAGPDRSTGLPTVQKCNSRFVCSEGTVVGSKETSIVRLVISPGFSDDRTLFAITVKGLFRSTDAGNSFVPAAVAPVSTGTLISTVQAMAFTPDFNSSKGSGRVFAAVLSVARAASGGVATVAGGIFESQNGVDWNKVGEPSALDSGATAVAATPDGRVFGGYINPQEGHLVGGIMCTGDRRSWKPYCMPYASSTGKPQQGETSAGASAVNAPGESGAASIPGGESGAASVPGSEVGVGSRGPDDSWIRSEWLRGGFLGVLLLSFAGIGIVRWRARVRRGGKVDLSKTVPSMQNGETR